MPTSDNFTEADEHQGEGQSVPGLARFIEDKAAVEYLTLKTVDSVDQRIREREGRRHRAFAFALMVLGVLGFGGIGAILNSEIQSRIDQKASELKLVLDERLQLLDERVQSDIEQRSSITNRTVEQRLELMDAGLSRQVGEFRQELRADALRETTELTRSQIGGLRASLQSEQDFNSFVYLVSRLEQRDSISSADADATVAVLRRLAPVSEITNRPEFVSHLEVGIDALFSANLIHHISEIEESLEPVILGSPGIVLTMLLQHGFSALGSPRGLNEEAIDDLERYITAARRHSRPDIALLYELLLEFARNGEVAGPSTQHLVSSVDYLRPESRTDFFKALDTVCVSNDATYEARRVSELCRRLRESHPEMNQDIGALLQNESLSALRGGDLEPFLAFMRLSYFETELWLAQIAPLFPAFGIGLELDGSAEQQDGLAQWVEVERSRLVWNQEKEVYEHAVRQATSPSTRSRQSRLGALAQR